MRRYLVVAHRTLGGSQLLDEIRRRVEAGSCQFHLVVPVYHPRDHRWTDHEVEAEAQRVLDTGTQRLRDLGAEEVTGEIGDANPIYAIETALRDHQCDEIIVSTLPAGPSRWLKLDVPTRIAKEFKLPLTHVVAQPETVS
ncbi:MAG: hypothetical protein ACRD0U_07220 [Acidimicrobiales bacterium]